MDATISRTACTRFSWSRMRLTTSAIFPLPSLSGTFDPRIGPLITLFLTPPAVLEGALQGSAVAAAQQAPLSVHATIALVDTGASITSVTAVLARQVGLPRTFTSQTSPFPLLRIQADQLPLFPTSVF